MHGAEAIGAAITRSCELARDLESRIRAETALELIAPAQLNIVCFRYRAVDADRLNGEIVVALQESGIAAPSLTTVDGKVVIRAALFNHRTRETNIAALVDAVLRIGAHLAAAQPASRIAR